MGYKATFAVSPHHVRFAPESGHRLSLIRRLLSARSGQFHDRRSAPYCLAQALAWNMVNQDGGGIVFTRSRVVINARRFRYCNHSSE